MEVSPSSSPAKAQKFPATSSPINSPSHATRSTSSSAVSVAHLAARSRGVFPTRWWLPSPLAASTGACAVCSPGGSTPRWSAGDRSWVGPSRRRWTPAQGGCWRCVCSWRWGRGRRRTTARSTPSSSARPWTQCTTWNRSLSTSSCAKPTAQPARPPGRRAISRRCSCAKRSWTSSPTRSRWILASSARQTSRQRADSRPEVSREGSSPPLSSTTGLCRLSGPTSSTAPTTVDESKPSPSSTWKTNSGNAASLSHPPSTVCSASRGSRHASTFFETGRCRSLPLALSSDKGSTSRLCRWRVLFSAPRGSLQTCRSSSSQTSTLLLWPTRRVRVVPPRLRCVVSPSKRRAMPSLNVSHHTSVAPAVAGSDSSTPLSAVLGVRSIRSTPGPRGSTDPPFKRSCTMRLGRLCRRWS
mmetsp:Transcript_57615/g.125248  ORF Transcript_57615/g.125248 Transcript_57615/m.125248 type:complete len:413 (+) Transcript_57615:967-2205(+)